MTPAQMKKVMIIDSSPSNYLIIAVDMKNKKIKTHNVGSLVKVHCLNDHDDYKETKKKYMKLQQIW